MEGGTEAPLVAAQRSVIVTIRGRYERGELPFDAFREALDAITQAQTPEECAAIVRDLPHSPLAALAALEALAPAVPPTPAPSAPAPSGFPAPRGRSRITAFMAETQKTSRAWTLAPDTEARALMGALKLDLRRAKLPPHARIRVRATMGEVVIYVPDDVAVVVRSTVWMGETRALGESVEGVVASGHTEHYPTGVEPRAHIEIDVHSLMGSVNIALVNPTSTTVTISELARETVRAALESARRGWESGGQGAASLRRPDGQPGLPGGRAE